MKPSRQSPLQSSSFPSTAAQPEDALSRHTANPSILPWAIAPECLGQILGSHWCHRCCAS
ncbi:hypothetical protein X977_4933 [Burkholderia pseudomallei MSHR7504]|nr:hypothetical protein X977_4933 [Burkholderia pseudomallei MSHR7504]